jgi:malate dehydrogenase (oxaloacetate-decarboxylating)(NADP+)
VAIHATKQMVNQHDLALAYSPGVARRARRSSTIRRTPFRYTARGNLVA